jgi:L-threonylcarbamoyladenylate synthase
MSGSVKILESLSDPKTAELLSGGAVGVIPTDTVYGIVCQAADEAAVQRLYALKNRQQKPGTVIAASIDQLVGLGIKARYLKAVQHYWPNPISIVIPNHELAYLHLGVGGIAVRLPADPELQKLLSRTGPLLTTSVNHAGEPEAVNIKQAQDYFGDKIDFYSDGGDLSDRLPSTVIRIVDDAMEILRLGAVNIKENGEIQP